MISGNKHNRAELMRAFLPMIAVFLINQFFLVMFGLYILFPSADIPMHILGGVASAWTVVLLGGYIRKQRGTNIQPPWVWWLVIVAGVALFAVGWECYEFVRDTWLPARILMQPGVRDTMADLVLGLVGAVLFIVVRRPKF